MPGVLAKLYRECLELLFPRQCLGCALEGAWLCPACDRRLERLTTLTCLACGRRRPQGRTCEPCRKKLKLTGLVAALSYRQALSRELIHELKYHSIRGIAPILGSILAERLKHLAPQVTLDAALVAVPLHPRRERERGFNQAALIAKELSKTLAIPFVSALARTRKTKSQIELNDPDLRRENVSGAFALRTPTPLLPKRILLVDDVATTGATLSACAHVLRQAGVREVWGVVVAR